MEYSWRFSHSRLCRCCTSSFHSYSIDILSDMRCRKRGLKSRPTRVMFAAIVVSFVLATLIWSCEVAHYAMEIQRTLVEINDKDFTAMTLIKVRENIAFLLVIENWARHLLIILSDGIVVWRAWVLFIENRWMMICPCFLFFVTSVVNITYVSFYSTSIWIAVVQANLPHSSINLLFNSALALSIGTNAVATLLILYRLWTHRKTRSSLGLKERSPVQKILLILIESGVVFFAIQLANLIMSFMLFNHYSVTDYVQTVIYMTYTMFVAMYPSMIIYLVDQQRSLVETFGFTAPSKHFEAGNAELGLQRTIITIGHLSFARSPEETTTLGSQVEVSRSDRDEVPEVTEKDNVGKRSQENS
ncbi:hypothetical protein D9615_006984 [Tricholomella constricta]|uniref:Uncharacterized protein n=1 Tax=Tricholomella constricta TaxID=117010 RepID=A0A8H5H8Z4_9AGAR|nr:hypothetical protein D9615_006984 [Tricholomella constricta]